MNDERPIEKLLRRYAKKRHDDAGDLPGVHPATRRLLQGEVARQYPKSTHGENRTSAVNFFTLLTKRWTYAVGVFVVLGVTAIVLLPSLKTENRGFLALKEEEPLAVRESLSPATTAPAAVTPPAESQSSKLTLADSARNQPLSEPSGGGNFVQPRDEPTTLSRSVTDASAGSRSGLADAKSDSADASFKKTEESKRFSLGANLDSAATTTRNLSVQSPARSAGEAMQTDSLSVAQTRTQGRSDAADRYNEARQTPPPPAAPAPSVASRGVQDKNILARGGGLEKDSERFYSQSFANAVPDQLRERPEKAKAEAPATSVLSKFQVQQIGNQVRVVDGDGSTYLGEVNTNFADDRNATVATGRETAAYAFENAKKPTPQSLVGGTAGAQQATQNYFWRVEGTNRTLNQNVVFTWNFVPTTSNMATLQLNTTSSLLNQESLTSPLQFPALLNNSTINGRAQLGPAQQIEVNAVPVK